MVYDPVEDGLGPGGRSAKLFQHHGRHASIQGLQIVSFSLSICPALGHLFSEKLFGHIEIQVDSVDLHIQPELGALRFMMCTSALWMGLTLPGAGCPSSWIWSGISMACSVAAVKPACRASLAIRSLMWSCLRVWRPLVQRAACLP